jgi:RNA polymerase sigma factor (sigma-70 family)
MDWRIVVERIHAGDPAGEEILYRNLFAGARLFLQRRLGKQDVEDRVHDLFVIVVQTIRRGELREPERLMGFVRTVLNRQLNLEISQIIHARQASLALDSVSHLTTTQPSPEQQAATHQKITLMKQVLSKMSRREFEILTRFYLREHPPQQIQREMGITQTQFNLLKSRAKARLTTLVQRRLVQHPVSRE